MPQGPKKVCRFRTCQNTHRNSNGYCDEHQEHASNWKGWQAKRGNRHKRGYGHKWDQIRKEIKARDKNLCQVCLKNGKLSEAHAVDHIKPKAQGGSDHESNLQCICKECHNKKTSRES